MSIYDKSRNALYMYQILSAVKPRYEETKYPYNPWTPNKVHFTMKEIDLLPNAGVFKISPHPRNSAQVGGNADEPNNEVANVGNEKIIVFVL
jgi:hypothetical protein